MGGGAVAVPEGAREAGRAAPTRPRGSLADCACCSPSTATPILLVGHALALRYVLDAAEGLAPAALMRPVEHAHPYRLDRAGVERAAALLEAWSLAPQFRTA